MGLLRCDACGGPTPRPPTAPRRPDRPLPPRPPSAHAAPPACRLQSPPTQACRRGGARQRAAPRPGQRARRAAGRASPHGGGRGGRGRQGGGAGRVSWPPRGDASLSAAGASSRAFLERRGGWRDVSCLAASLLLPWMLLCRAPCRVGAAFRASLCRAPVRAGPMHPAPPRARWRRGGFGAACAYAASIMHCVLLGFAPACPSLRRACPDEHAGQGSRASVVLGCVRGPVQPLATHPASKQMQRYRSPSDSAAHSLCLLHSTASARPVAGAAQCPQLRRCTSRRAPSHLTRAVCAGSSCGVRIFRLFSKLESSYHQTKPHPSLRACCSKHQRMQSTTGPAQLYLQHL